LHHAIVFIDASQIENQSAIEYDFEQEPRIEVSVAAPFVSLLHAVQSVLIGAINVGLEESFDGINRVCDCLESRCIEEMSEVAGAATVEKRMSESGGELECVQ
jgi:hypothetical protein